MCFFDIEPAGFHCLEAHLDLPPLGIVVPSLPESVEGNDDKKVPFFELASREVTILAVDRNDLVVVPVLTGPQVVEQPRNFYFFSLAGKVYLKVISDTDVVSDLLPIELGYPFLAHQLPVGHKAFYTFPSEEPYKTFDQVYSFLAVGVPPLVEHGKEQWKHHPLIDRPQHEDIDVRFPELPIGAVDGQLYLITLR
jgi:hypothetical protein